MGMDTMGGMGEEKLNPLMQFYMSLPEWGQALARTLIVILAAALIGMILGRLYASVRYPDPEKNSAISPKLRVLFLAVLLVCGFWLYRSMTKKDEPRSRWTGREFRKAFRPTNTRPRPAEPYANVGGARRGGGSRADLP